MAPQNRRRSSAAKAKTPTRTNSQSSSGSQLKVSRLTELVTTAMSDAHTHNEMMQTKVAASKTGTVPADPDANTQWTALLGRIGHINTEIEKASKEKRTEKAADAKAADVLRNTYLRPLIRGIVKARTDLYWNDYSNQHLTSFEEEDEEEEA